MRSEAKPNSKARPQIGDGPGRHPERDAATSASTGTKRQRALRYARHSVEVFGAYLVFTLFRLLPVDSASALGGFTFRVIGPLTREHQMAKQNIKRALPHLTEDEIRSTLVGMWDNLGRIAAELPHLARLAHDHDRVEIVDRDGLLAALRRNGEGALMVSGHYGNWELGGIPALRAGLVQHTVYRVPNNPAIDRLISKLRRPAASGEFIPKGRKGLWDIVSALRRREVVGMLVDQKLKEGTIVPFFGRDARTTDAPAALSHRFGVPIILVKVERLGGVRFRISISQFKTLHSKNEKDPFVEPTRQLNEILEDWIRARPNHWLWAHRRWHN